MEAYENVAPREYGTSYTLSTDINEILQVSTNIYEIEVTNIYEKAAERRRLSTTAAC